MYPDTLLISGSIVSIGRTSMKMSTALQHQSSSSRREGDSVLVMFDYQSQKPVVVPDDLRANIEAFEGRSLRN